MHLRKLANSFAHLCFFCSLSFTLMSFTDGKSTTSGDPKKDSISLAKNFKTLFPSTLVPDLTISIPLNPIVTPFVTSFLSKQSNNYTQMKVWGKSYFDLFDRILTENNIPNQLKYLSVIESNLKPALISSAGAVGPWQLMSSVARSYGLRTGKIDDRKDFTKSTKVAAQMLSSLYKSLGDWLLVIAAYNAGEGRVRQAIKEAHSNDYWNIQKYLPLETRNHVKKFIATHFFFEGGGSVATMTNDEIKTNSSKALEQSNNEFSDKVENGNDLKSVEIQGRYNSTLMAKYLQMDIAYFNRINPGLNEALNRGTSYNLNLPSDKVALFTDLRQEILKESIELLMINSSLIGKQ